MLYHLFAADELKLDLVFEEDELADFKELWGAGISLVNIAKKMRRQPSEIALLVFDHAERGLIRGRNTGYEGI